jgi:hypothetical protein
MVVACGGGRPPEKTVSPSPNVEQSLADGVAALCSAPTRAESDPDWMKATEPSRKASILGKHLIEGVENPRALQVANAAPDRHGPELDAIVKEAGITPCRLQEVWSPAEPVAPTDAPAAAAPPSAAPR